MKKSEKEHSKFNDTIRSVGEFLGGALITSLKAAAAAAAATAAAVGEAVAKGFEFSKGAGEMADNVLTMSTVTGVSTETLQQWTYASQFMDTSVETMTNSMARMTREVGNAADGNKTAQEKFDRLGVSIRDSSGSLRSAEDIFMDSIDALGKVSNETERDALAMDLFGKSAQELNPLIQTGSAGLKALGEEASSMGTVFSGDALKAMGGFDDSMQRFNQTGEALKNTIGLTLIPAFQPLVDTATTAMSDIAVALQDGLQPGEVEAIMGSIISTIDTTLAGLGTMITEALPSVTGGISKIVSGVVTYLPGLLEAITPAAMELLQGLMTAVSANVEPIMTAATTLIGSMGTFIVKNIPLLVETAKTIITTLIEYIKLNAASMVDGATQIITGIIDGITSLLPDLIPLAVDMMTKLGVELVNALPTLVAKLPEIVTAIIDGLKAVDWLQVGTDLLTGLYNGLSAALTSIIDTITGVFVSIWDAIKKVFGIASPSTVAAEAGGFILKGLVEGFAAAVDGVVSTVKAIFGKIWDAIKSIFGFGSESEESKEAKEAGKDIMTGMQKGIDDNKSAVENAVTNVSKDVLKKFRSELGVPEGGGNSTKTRPFGESVDKGIADGITAKGAESTFSGPAGTVKNGIASAFGSAFGIGGGWPFSAAAASQFKSIGDAVAQGIANGIGDGAGKIKTAATDAAQKALAAAKKELGIASPSKRAYSELGVPFIQGLSNALSDGKRVLQESVGGVVRGMTDVRMQPVQLDTAGMGNATPVRAELTLNERVFGEIVFELSDRGIGNAQANMRRLQMGVQLG